MSCLLKEGDGGIGVDGAWGELVVDPRVGRDPKVLSIEGGEIGFVMG